MLTGTIVFAAIAALLAAPLVGLLLLRHLLAGETSEYGADDTVTRPVPLHAMMWRHFLRVLGETPRLLTYRRNARGRFRAVRR